MSAVEVGVVEAVASVYPVSIYLEAQSPESSHDELSPVVAPDIAAADVGAVALAVANKLSAFEDCVGLVPASAVEEMTYAVASVCHVVYQLAGLDLNAEGHSVGQNLSKAARVLRADKIARTDKSAETLGQVVACVEELFRGFEQARAQQA